MGAIARVTEDSGTDVNDGSFAAGDTAFDVGDGTKLAIGQTILIDSEQLYITGIATNNITVTRGVNGTTAASHSNSTDIYIYRYPDAVTQVCLMQTARLWKRKDVLFHPPVRGEASRGLLAGLWPLIPMQGSF